MDNSIEKLEALINQALAQDVDYKIMSTSIDELYLEGGHFKRWVDEKTEEIILQRRPKWMPLKIWRWLVSR